jgi:putative effector of murein hydrolase LrgA (UPF0299 family)
MLAVLTGLGLLASLSLPWFAAPETDPNDVDGPVERAAFQVSRVFASGAKGTVDGSAAAGSARVAIVGIVVLVTLLALAVLTPAIRRQAEDLLHLVALAVPIVVLLVVIAHPGTTTPVHLHYGTLVSLAVSLFMASAAWNGARMREKRKPTARPRYGTTR